MIAVIGDFHIASPWASTVRQHLVLDMIEDLAPDGVIFVGDTLEQMAGKQAMIDCPVFQRLRDKIAKEIPITLLPGNWPHDEARWLATLADDLGPIKIWDHKQPCEFAIHGRTWRLTHGADFDPRLRHWHRWRWTSRILPWVTRHILGRAPSELANAGLIRDLVDLSSRIHRRAVSAALDAGVNIIMGHTHLGSSITAEPSDGPAATVYDLGAAGMDHGSAYIAHLDTHAGMYLTPIPSPGEIRALTRDLPEGATNTRPAPDRQNAAMSRANAAWLRNQRPPVIATDHVLPGEITDLDLDTYPGG